MGLNQVRELTRRTQEPHPAIPAVRLVSGFPGARPTRARWRRENLARAGALEGFGTIPALLRQLEQGGWRGGQLPLFDLAGPDRRGLDHGREDRR